MWVADNSAVTLQSAACPIGLTKATEANRGDAITIGNRDTEQVTKIADISVELCNKFGVELNCSALQS